MGLHQRMTARLRALRGFLRRAGADARGNVAMMFGLALPVLLMIVVGAIDINRASTARVTLQDALDAATLAAARSPYTSQIDIQRVGMDALRANLENYPGLTLMEDETTFTLVDEEVIVADARVNVKTLVANIFLPPYGQILDDYLPIGTHAEVNRSSKDIEVSLVLDITGSMAGNRLTDLKSAANDLVDLVVQDEQRINRTRMALVPYSMGVNPGTYAVAARGAMRGQTTITGASWMSSGWSAKTISGVSIANPGVITANGHGLATGDFIWLSGVTNTSSGSGSSLATLLNNSAYRVVRTSANTFTLERWSGGRWSAVSTSGRKAYTVNSGTFRKCQISTCEVVVTSNSHDLTDGEEVRIAEVRGMTQINNTVNDGSSTQNNLFHTITRQSADAFSLNGVYGADVSNYESRGYVQCLSYQCQFFKFQNYSNRIRIKEVSDCVSERTGVNAYSDVAPGAYPVGLTYPSTDNPCLASTIQPLTSDRSVLHNQINGYAAVGSTAGQIGVGWGWYMISPTFGSIFPADNRPDPYAGQGLLKVVILMTDGEFNTPYCRGVVAGAASGSGDTNQHTNCSPPNGNPFAQSVNMCTAMKAKGVIVYTVGFDISSGSDSTPSTIDTAKEVMEHCATSPEHVYLPENGSSLKTAFAAIGRSISQLRISK